VEPDSWGIRLARLHKEGSRFVQGRLAPLGLATGLHPYLLALEAGPLHQEALTDELLVDKANTARALAKLEASGWVLRRACPEDARKKVVELTAKGRALLEPVKAVLADWESDLRSRIPLQDQKQLTRLLVQLAQKTRLP